LTRMGITKRGVFRRMGGDFHLRRRYSRDIGGEKKGKKLNKTVRSYKKTW